MTKVSVILPVYNTERHLDATLRSVLAQTFRDFELIIIDDGSRDASHSIASEFAGQDGRIRLIRRPNRGLVATLNEGLSLARGQYIARMDADDRALPQRFERQVERLEQDPELVAIGSQVIAIDQDDRVLGLEVLPLAHDEIEDWHLSGSSAICHPAVMLRAAAVRGVGGYRDLSPVEDYDLWLRLGEVGRLANLEEPLLIYRRSQTGMVATNAHRRMPALERALRDAWQRRGLPGEPEMPRQHLRTSADLFRQWGWLALDSGQTATARRYAWKAVRTQPWTWRSWKLALCALRGPAPQGASLASR